MLLSKLFTKQTFFLQAINYFNYNSLVKADGETTGNLSSNTSSTFILSEYVKHDVIPLWKNYDIFLRSRLEGYYDVASFAKRLFNFNSLEIRTAIKGAIFKVQTCNTNKVKDQPKLEEYTVDIMYDFGEIPENVAFFRVCMKKTTFNKILDDIKENKNHDITKIFLQLPAGENICLLQMRLGNDKLLHRYMPQKDLSESSINELLGKDSLTFPKMDKEIFLYIIEFFRKYLTDKKKLTILKVGDSLNLHIDEPPIVFLYYTSMISYWEIFEKFTIKLKPYDEQVSRIKEIKHFKSKPSMLIEFCKINSSGADNSNFQFIFYNYDEPKDTYSCLNTDKYPSYTNLNFDNKPFITFEPKGIALHTTIVTLKATPILKIYFNKEGLSYKAETYKELEESISEVIIDPEEGNDSNTFTKDSFEINNEKGSFSINLNLQTLMKNENLPIKSTLENRDGLFDIHVKSGNETIIDSIVCLDDKIMVMLSSNKLWEYLEKYKLKNEDIKSTAEDNPPPKKDLIPTNSDRKKEDKPIQQVVTVSNANPNPPDAKSNLPHTTDQSQNEHKEESESESEELNVVPFSTPQPLNDTGGLQKYDNTNPTAEVTKTTTSKESNENISDSKPEDTDKTTDSKDTPGNKKSKSGNKTLIIIACVASGLSLLGGTAAYIFFS